MMIKSERRERKVKALLANIFPLTTQVKEEEYMWNCEKCEAISGEKAKEWRSNQSEKGLDG